MYSEYQKKRMQNLSNEKWDNAFKLTEYQIHNWFDKQKEDLSEAILTKLKNTDPFVFENIMIKLMSKMGYKGADEKVFVTQKSNDGGIDDILNQDALGLRKIYVQVKCYAEDNTVSRQTISQFHGDLDLQGGAGTSVFITTSSFTKGAEATAKRFNINLINGETLIKLMIRYKVGVQVRDIYKLYEIDNDFFKE